MCLSVWAISIALALFALPARAQQSQSPPAASSPQTQSSPPGQSTAPGSGKPSQTDNSKDQDAKKKDDRMFYVMPNFLTVDNASQVKPLTVKEKFVITARGAFDPYEFIIVGVLAGIRQANDTDPAFGQGATGYAKRYGTAFADQVDGNMMVGAVFPSLLKTDPRYFQLGKGGFAHRFEYALSRIVVTRRDSGGQMFNVPEFLGNGVAIGISNLYYPPADRTVSNFFTSWGTQLAIDALGNELKEFWPDIHRKISKKK
jgi:hypothetical protein